ncbi:C-type lectin domain family 4 member E-like isoform 1-T1 [Pholidichthys leucotaenia]
MAVFFHSSVSDIDFEVGEYQQIHRSAPEVPATKTAPKPNSRLLGVVLLSFGLLCVLQAVLNIALRLVPSQSKDRGEIQEEVLSLGCPQSWLRFDSSCYYISSQRRTWDQSRQDCMQRDADLVIINSRREQAFITGFTEAAWVGMTDREVEGTWIWVDGTPVDRKGLLWALGQPDDSLGGEDCGDLRTMSDFLGLNDFNCIARMQWICERAVE